MAVNGTMELKKKAVVSYLGVIQRGVEALVVVTDDYFQEGLAYMVSATCGGSLRLLDFRRFTLLFCWILLQLHNLLCRT